MHIGITWIQVKSNLTEAEQQLLARIIPHVKIIKYDGIFGQKEFKGQVVLFAQYIFTDKLPIKLTRSPECAGLQVFAREFSVSTHRLNAALNWIISQKPLYCDGHNATDDVQINLNDFVRLQNPFELRIEQPLRSRIPISETSTINSCSMASRRCNQLQSGICWKTKDSYGKFHRRIHNCQRTSHQSHKYASRRTQHHRQHGNQIITIQAQDRISDAIKDIIAPSILSDSFPKI